MTRTVESSVFKLVFCFVMAGLVVACGQKGDHDEALKKVAADADTDYESSPSALTETILDTLRVMKERFNVSRDEYWNNRGGVLGNDFFEVWYPPGGATVTHGMFALEKLMDAKKKFHSVFGSNPSPRLRVICSTTMEGYTDRTGLEWFVYSKIDGDEVHYQPIAVLVQRKLADCAVPRGYFEWGILRMSGNRAPQWLVQGFSSMLSGEEETLENQLTEFPDYDIKMQLEDITEALDKKTDRRAYRVALYNAYRMVRRVTAHHDRDKLAGVIRMMGDGEKMDDACQKIFGLPYEEVLADAMDFKVNK